MNPIRLDRLRALIGTPTWPDSLERPPVVRRLGIDYDTSWARTPAVRGARALVTDGVTRPLTKVLTTPTIYGAEQLEDIDGPVIFAANHTSHLDTSVLISSLPRTYRHHVVVAAAADYFFDRAWKAGLFGFLLSTIPVERRKINRKSSDVAADLIAHGWSLVIFPEGGRSHDGWGQEFSGGAGYLSKRCDVPVVPVHLKGVRPVFPRGSSKLRPGKVEVRFGKPMRALEKTGERDRPEDTRRFANRIERAVEALADEAETDWWTARQRAAKGESPSFRGPATASWRRAWSLPESARTYAEANGDNSSKPW